MKKLMHGPATKIDANELEEMISQLEDCYAELMRDDEDKYTIRSVWLRLNELKAELTRRNY